VTTLDFVHHLSMPYDASIGPGWHYYLHRLGAVVAGTTVPANRPVAHQRMNGDDREHDGALEDLPPSPTARRPADSTPYTKDVTT
jgi:hypothetical protein